MCVSVRKGMPGDTVKKVEFWTNKKKCAKTFDNYFHLKRFPIHFKVKGIESLPQTLDAK